MILGTWWHWPSTAIFGVRQIPATLASRRLAGKFLEDELGVMLLKRTSRKVLFTQAGMLLVDQARTVLREVKVLKEMASQQGETRPLLGLIPQLDRTCYRIIILSCFPKLEMYLHEAQTHRYWRNWTAANSIA